MGPASFRFELLEEKMFPQMIKEWWKELKVDGWVGYRLGTKLKLLKVKIKEWAKMNFADMKMQKTQLLEDIQNLDKKAEVGSLTGEEVAKRLTKRGISKKVKGRRNHVGTEIET
ncbi:hypothetical protein AAC387_Pa09g0968 [Persea americana]